MIIIIENRPPHGYLMIDTEDPVFKGLDWSDPDKLGYTKAQLDKIIEKVPASEKPKYITAKGKATK